VHPGVVGRRVEVVADPARVRVLAVVADLIAARGTGVR
jgi:hypothetical protein